MSRQKSGAGTIFVFARYALNMTIGLINCHLKNLLITTLYSYIGIFPSKVMAITHAVDPVSAVCPALIFFPPTELGGTALLKEQRIWPWLHINR